MIRIIDDAEAKAKYHSEKLVSQGMEPLKEFKFGYTVYYGCGHHLYAYLNEFLVGREAVEKIIQANFNNPDGIAFQLRSKDNTAKVVVTDSEFGSITVW